MADLTKKPGLAAKPIFGQSALESRKRLPQATQEEEDRQSRIQKLASQAAQTPETTDKVVNSMQAATSQLDPKDQQDFSSRLEEAKRIFEEGKKRSDWGEVAEKVGHALTQLAAGYQGLQTGVDMSGLKFDKTDWGKRYDNLLNEYKTEVGIAERDRARSDEVAEKDLRRKELEEREDTEERRHLESLGFRKEQLQQQIKEREADRRERARQKALDRELKAKQEEAVKKETALDKAYAKQYTLDVLSGGLKRSKHQINSLEKVISVLDSGEDVSGLWDLVLPNKARKLARPRSVEVQQIVEKVIQDSLKATLGTQFTAREGADLIARTYDPDLDESINARKVKALLNQLKDISKDKTAAANYYQKNNRSMEGYQGRLYDPDTMTHEDFDLETTLEEEGKGRPKMVRIRDPKGNIRLVPADRVSEALKANGKRVD